MNRKPFSLIKRLRSFTYAINGLRILFKEEHNARIHLFAAVCVVLAGYWLNISATEWLVILLTIGFVFAMELMNSAIESIADFISPDKHEKIKAIKDLAAAGVLISAITALFIGVFIFLPRIMGLFGI